MASQIYSRYIPPNKKRTTTNSRSENEAPLSSATFSPILPTPPATRHDASSTYARYIPPSKPKSKPVAQSVISASAEESSSPYTTKRKRNDFDEPKKSKKAKDSSHITASVAKPNSDNLSSPVQTGRHAETELKQEKSKKRKPIDDNLSSGGDVSISENQEEADNERHKKVLMKREKSLRKAERIAKRATEEAALGGVEVDPEGKDIPEAAEIHDLGPLPQPEPVPEAPAQSILSSLPSWLASPIRIAPTTSVSFRNLGIQEEVAHILESKGFKDAFAVQAAVLPLLLPGPLHQAGDILVSAATGSGKTLAYVLPMVENISNKKVTRLRGLIVMPTRELVIQAREVCEICALAFSAAGKKRVRVGTAIGNQPLKQEQSALMDQELKYDPIQYRQNQRWLNAKWESSDQESEGEDIILFEDECLPTLPDHVVEAISKVDILICTPGRLVEHLKSTPGFSLEHVNWLVIDEADKLLGQSFQQWLDTLMQGFYSSRQAQAQHNNAGNRIQKIILSATMTRDIGQLSALKLYRPKLVVLESSLKPQDDVREFSDANVLPPLLSESAIKVDNESDKPLYLMELLMRQDMIFSTTTSPDSKLDISSSDSDDDSSVSSGSSPRSSRSHQSTKRDEQPPVIQNPGTPRGVLIFTKSNETAVRLSRLIVLLQPKYADLVGTLTSTTPSSTRRAALNSFQAGGLSILVASDLASRGLDLPHLAHVVNYDIPTSLTSYVHRVGRTARAGKKGFAWTLLTNSEARWFWNEIARSKMLERAVDSKVARMNIDSAASFDLAKRTRYEEALERLGREASGTAKPSH